MSKMESLSRAIIFATEAHDGQFDKGGQPYILHPLRVMSLLKGESEEILCAALLHDVFEDTKKTFREAIASGIPEEAIRIAKLVTKMPGQSQEEYEELVMSDVGAMKVKRADLRHNSDIRRLKGVSEKDIARMVKYQQFYLKIDAHLANLERKK